jgi:cell fate regulator YaaT (PSP1 superfamily)
MYGAMGLREPAFSLMPDLHIGESVILATERGTEWGTILPEWDVLAERRLACLDDAKDRRGGGALEPSAARNDEDDALAEVEADAENAPGANAEEEQADEACETDETCETDENVGAKAERPLVAASRNRHRRRGPVRIKILRRPTPEDVKRRTAVEKDITPEDIFVCRRLIEKHRLPMRLIGVEHLLGDERILFYFRSEQRVDFRALVRDLARELHTRIELRQIGPRDEARLNGDQGVCGRELCCRSCLRKLEPIPMRMAKLQAPGVDPGKIYGRCGKLKCCLRYEEALYSAQRARLPERGTRVRFSEEGAESFEGEVVGGDAYNERVHVLLPDGSRRTVPLKNVKPVRAGAQAAANVDRRTESSATETPHAGASSSDQRRGRSRRPQPQPQAPSRRNRDASADGPAASPKPKDNDSQPT